MLVNNGAPGVPDPVLCAPEGQWRVEAFEAMFRLHVSAPLVLAQVRVVAVCLGGRGACCDEGDKRGWRSR